MPCFPSMKKYFWLGSKYIWYIAEKNILGIWVSTTAAHFHGLL